MEILQRTALIYVVLLHVCFRSVSRGPGGGLRRPGGPVSEGPQGEIPGTQGLRRLRPDAAHPRPNILFCPGQTQVKQLRIG